MAGINADLLRGVIFTKYKTQAAFAESIGWHRNKVSALLNGAYIPDVDEAAMIFDDTQMTLEQYVSIFLTRKSPNGDKRVQPA